MFMIKDKMEGVMKKLGLCLIPKVNNLREFRTFYSYQKCLQILKVQLLMCFSAPKQDTTGLETVCES